jgi:hypothetical protein
MDLERVQLHGAEFVKSSDDSSHHVDQDDDNQRKIVLKGLVLT